MPQLIGANLIFERGHPTGGAAYLVAIAPALPIIGVFVALARYLQEEQDEYLRLVQMQQMLVATGLTLSLATAWGFVESFGLAPHVPGYAGAILWYAALGLTACVRALRERGA